MKKYYQTPETEIVTVGLSKVILDDEPEFSGELVNPEANKNVIIDETDFLKGEAGNINLWDE